MTEFQTMALIFGMLAAFSLGIRFGAKGEARIWRDKAAGEPRMCSGGKFYRVTEEP